MSSKQVKNSNQIFNGLLLGAIGMSMSLRDHETNKIFRPNLIIPHSKPYETEHDKEIIKKVRSRHNKKMQNLCKDIQLLIYKYSGSGDIPYWTKQNIINSNLYNIDYFTRQIYDNNFCVICHECGKHATICMYSDRDINGDFI